MAPSNTVRPYRKVRTIGPCSQAVLTGPSCALALGQRHRSHRPPPQRTGISGRGHRARSARQLILPRRQGDGYTPGGDLGNVLVNGCCGQLDRAGAARAPAADERCAPVRPEGDHLGVSPVSGSSPVAVPVRGMRLDLVARGPGGAGGGDGVGSAGTRAVHQQDTPVVPVQDHRQGPTAPEATRWSPRSDRSQSRVGVTGIEPHCQLGNRTDRGR
jgi:hypothetical protein